MTEPCPLAIELDLPAGGRLFFVSDLHLTDGGVSNDFDAADELGELIAAACAHPGPVIFVLGGDILDLLQVMAPPLEAAAKVLEAPHAVELGNQLRALADRRDASIVYLVGNHDSTLAWDGRARSRVAERFGAAFAVELHVRVAGGDGGDVRLVAEHGHALDRYNRRADPFDPLESTPGDHMVTEVVNRVEAASERYPELALDQVDNVRPSLMVSWWMVSNFFYRFMSRALRHFALPLLALFVILRLGVLALVVSEVPARVAALSTRAVRWTLSVVVADVVLLAVLSTFLGRMFRRAGAAYGVPSPDEADEEVRARRAGIPPLLEQRHPDAMILVAGHTHQPELTRFPDGKVGVDAGCWIAGLVPVPGRLGLPPVFVSAYPCNWVEVQAVPGGVGVRLLERRLAIAQRVNFIERLVAKRPWPSATTEPIRVVADAVVACPARAR